MRTQEMHSMAKASASTKVRFHVEPVPACTGHQCFARRTGSASPNPRLKRWHSNQTMRRPSCSGAAHSHDLWCHTLAVNPRWHACKEAGGLHKFMGVKTFHTGPIWSYTSNAQVLVLNDIALMESKPEAQALALQSDYAKTKLQRCSA